MNAMEVLAAFSRVEFRRDRRKAPDLSRRRQFRIGWDDFTKRRKIFSPDTLEKLTWRSLGYRMAIQFGDVPEGSIDFAFDVLAASWTTPTPITAPSAQQYAEALLRLRPVSELQLALLRTHYHSFARTITATQLARSVGFSRYSSANAHYGRLGRLLGDSLEWNPIKERLGTLVTFEKRNSEWHWIMRPELAHALELVGWIDSESVTLSQEILPGMEIVEGAVSRILINSYERNAKARRLCLDHYGLICQLCGFDFVARYGEFAKNCIHVHHLQPLAEIKSEYVVDPIKDLLPVCPNCHAVVHSRNPAYQVGEIQDAIQASLLRLDSCRNVIEQTITPL